jgi:hypothetical protein
VNPRASSTTRSPAQFARLWLTLLALFAFTLQAYVTQSHVHAAAVATKQLPGKVPAGDDQANCPLCQATLHAGYYVTPSAVAFVPPVLAVYGVFVATKVAAAIQTVSHGWNSRAPPQA